MVEYDGRELFGQHVLQGLEFITLSICKGMIQLNHTLKQN